jgi:hypothetical protein
MRVRMKVTMAGPDGCARMGEVVEVPAAQAMAMVEAGYADPVTMPAPAPLVETAAIEPPSNAMRPKPKPKKPAAK